MRIRIILLIAVTICFASFANAQTAKEITVFGQKIHYVEAGTGPTVILLHGLGGSTQVWQLSIGTGDIISWVKQDKPSISLNLSLFRFHFG